MKAKKAKQPQLPIAGAEPVPDGPLTPEEIRDMAEGYSAMMKILYSKPWDGMTPESIVADADAWERDFRNLPEEIARGKEGVVEEAVRCLELAKTCARAGNVPRAWEEMQIVARLSRWARKGGLFA